VSDSEDCTDGARAAVTQNARSPIVEMHFSGRGVPIHLQPSVRCPSGGSLENYLLCNVSRITVTFTTTATTTTTTTTTAAAAAMFVVVGEPCKESEAGRADAGKDQVTHRGQGDEEQWDLDRLAVSPQGRRASHEGTHHALDPFLIRSPQHSSGEKVIFYCKVWHFPQ